MVKRFLAVLLILTLSVTLLASCKAEESTLPENVSITVEPIEGLSKDFVMGADVSTYLSLEKSGVKFYDTQGNETDLFKLLSDAGINCVRLRVFNDPYDAQGNNYGAGICDVPTILEIGKRATAAGLSVMIDFHYSDFWADPSKQNAPKAWESYSLEEKETALYNFTKDSIQTFIDGGVDVEYVQIGNEITTGMCGESNDIDKYALVKVGCDAVAEVDSSIKRVVHFTNPEKHDFYKIAARLKACNVEYEVFSSSYYSYWHGTLENFTSQLKAVADGFGKQVMCTETAWAWTWEDGDGQGNVAYEGREWLDVSDYDISVQGQADAVSDVIRAVANVGDAGIGVFYWEPAWVPVNDISGLSGEALESTMAKNWTAWEDNGAGWATEASQEFDRSAVGSYGGSAWDNQALFDFSGKALDSLYTFHYVYTGTDK